MEKRCISDSFTFKCRFFRKTGADLTDRLSGETEEQELVRKTETEKEPPETAVETIIETETEETEKQTEVKKRPAGSAY
ncbi:MAG: hypothetical protein ACLR2E_06160 [Lachnospiraceae bacterium]